MSEMLFDWLFVVTLFLLWIVMMIVIIRIQSRRKR
jgi:hypothetical protein